MSALPAKPFWNIVIVGDLAPTEFRTYPEAIAEARRFAEMLPHRTVVVTEAVYAVAGAGAREMDYAAGYLSDRERHDLKTLAGPQ